MLAFGCTLIMPEVYERCARVGIELARESDSEVLAHAAAGSIARGYNLLLDRASALEDLEALVIVHEDVEIVDRDFAVKLRRVLADPQVAVVGCIGATGVRDIAWWDGVVRWNSASYRYGELGGGELLWPPPPGSPAAPGEVDSLYGVLLAFSPWAIQNLRFDESIGMLHGYDFDICRQARAAGRKVIAADLRVAHHHSLDLVGQNEVWVAAHMRAAELWELSESIEDGKGAEAAWRLRARRAEAAAAAARLLAASRLLQADASAKHHANRIEEVRGSRSWRLTEPLRRGNAALKAARSRLARVGASRLAP
jgi:GT2 family glycosyltransferase